MSRWTDEIDERIDAELEVRRRFGHLTGHQMAIATLLMVGYTKTEVAKHLGVTPQAIQVNVNRIKEVMRPEEE